MDITIHPGKLKGRYRATPSKSHAQRVLICAAFADKPTKILCNKISEDIAATVECLRALGAKIKQFKYGYRVYPIRTPPLSAALNCGESGATLRFLLPIVGALGVDTTFKMSGRLSQRPLSPLCEEMERMGCTINRPTQDSLRCIGKLRPGSYAITGNVSSQFISGLMMAFPIINGNCHLDILGDVHSAPYIDLTKSVLHAFEADSNNSSVSYRSPGIIAVEGDWSNAAFFLSAKKLGNNIIVSGLEEASVQGDRAVSKYLLSLKDGSPEISAADTPDLIPILAVCAAHFNGATFTDIQRLRFKESDRVESTLHMLTSLGADCCVTDNMLIVQSAKFHKCTIDPANDHRIAMAAAIAATVTAGDVRILNADCVNKSYPTFWEDFARLGGKYE